MEIYFNIIRNHYFDFAGRARRREYWVFCLVNAIICVLLALVATLLETPLLTSIYSLAVMFPSLGALVRRLHDTGRSGWFCLLAFIPLANFYVLYLLVQDSQPSTNDYGVSPKEIVS